MQDTEVAVNRLAVTLGSLVVLVLCACSAPETFTTPRTASGTLSPTVGFTPSANGSLWTETYGDDGENESVAALLSASDGGFLLIGTQGHYSQPDQNDVYRTYLLRTDSAGKQLWKKTIDDFQTMKQVSAAFEAAGKGFIIFATRMVLPRQDDTYQYELTVTGTDPQGDKLWSKTVEIGATPSAIVMNSSGAGFIMTGVTYATQEIEVTELDITGKVTAHRMLPLPVKGSDYQYYVARPAANGGFLVAARKITGERQSDIYLAEIDGEGRRLWSQTHSLPGFQLSPSDIMETSDGGIMLVGLGEPTTEYMRPFGVLYLAHLDSGGKKIWSMTWGDETHRQAASSVIETADGGYLIAGTKSPLMPKTGVAYLLRTDNRGNATWSKIFGDPAGDWWSEADALLPVSGGYVVAGEFGNVPPAQPSHDAFLMKTGLQGNYDPTPLLVSTTLPPTTDPQQVILKTISVDQTISADGIDLTLDSVVIRAAGFRSDISYTPPGYDSKAETVTGIPGIQAVFSIDGGPQVEFPVPPFSLSENGIQYALISDVQIPPGAKGLTIIITRLGGTQAGPWEFRVPL